MSNQSWRDRIVGARMQVDQKFASRVDSSEFSRQEWGLIMTSVEFEIENAADPEAARLVADTSRIADIMPEVDRAAKSQQQAMGGGPGGPGDGGTGGGLLDSLKGALGLGLGGSAGNREERVSTAVSLVDAYAVELQSHLEREGRWDEIRRAADGD